MTLPDRDSLATYGGPMSNYSDPIDPTTDEDASYRNKYAANVAMATRTLTRGFYSFLGTTGGATAIANPSSNVHDALWGDAPAYKPSCTHVATGTYDVSWPSTVQDELGETHSLSLRKAWGNVESSDSTLRLATAKLTGSQKVRVYTYQSGSLSDLVGETIDVFVI